MRNIKIGNTDINPTKINFNGKKVNIVRIYPKSGDPTYLFSTIKATAVKIPYSSFEITKEYNETYEDLSKNLYNYLTVYKTRAQSSRRLINLPNQDKTFASYFTTKGYTDFEIDNEGDTVTNTIILENLHGHKVKKIIQNLEIQTKYYYTADSTSTSLEPKNGISELEFYSVLKSKDIKSADYYEYDSIGIDKYGFVHRGDLLDQQFFPRKNLDNVLFNAHNRKLTILQDLHTEVENEIKASFIEYEFHDNTEIKSFIFTFSPFNAFFDFYPNFYIHIEILYVGGGVFRHSVGSPDYGTIEHTELKAGNNFKNQNIKKVRFYFRKMGSNKKIYVYPLIVGKEVSI